MKALRAGGEDSHSSRSPDVTVVIVSWNVADFLSNCIDSLMEHTPDLSLEIIVIDNNSCDHTLRILQERFPFVHVIANEQNVGFARANNQGFRQTKGRYILILNPDTILINDAITRMVRTLEEQPEVGVIGPRLLNPGGTTQRTCARLSYTLMSYLIDALHLGQLPIIGNALLRKFKFPYDYDISQPVEAVSGAAMLARREVIEQVNGFGEEFRHTGEDSDFCLRIRRAGWTIYYLADAAILHFSGQSSKQIPSEIYVNSVLSIEQYFRLNYGRLHALLFRLTIQLISSPIIILIGCLKILMWRETVEQFKIRWRTVRYAWKWQWVDLTEGRRTRQLPE